MVENNDNNIKFQVSITQMKEKFHNIKAVQTKFMLDGLFFPDHTDFNFDFLKDVISKKKKLLPIAASSKNINLPWIKSLNINSKKVLFDIVKNQFKYTDYIPSNLSYGYTDRKLLESMIYHIDREQFNNMRKEGIE